MKGSSKFWEDSTMREDLRWWHYLLFILLLPVLPFLFILMPVTCFVHYLLWGMPEHLAECFGWTISMVLALIIIAVVVYLCAISPNWVRAWL